MATDGQGARRSWGSMVRTARAAVAVLLIGGIGLTLPPQTRDMLAFLDANRVWAAISFQLALIVFGGSAWFWSRAALAARFGIDDSQRRQPAESRLRLGGIHLAATPRAYRDLPGWPGDRDPRARASGRLPEPPC